MKLNAFKGLEPVIERIYQTSVRLRGGVILGLILACVLGFYAYQTGLNLGHPVESLPAENPPVQSHQAAQGTEDLGEGRLSALEEPPAQAGESGNRPPSETEDAAFVHPNTAQSEGKRRPSGSQGDRRPVFPVHLGGAVQQPGVYEVTEGTYLQQLIDRAGGLAPQAALQALNLAQRLKPHQRYWIPAQGESPVWVENPSASQPALPDAGPSEQQLVNINEASVSELTSVEGVGPKTAQAIVQHREKHGPFRRLEGLMEVKGIKRGKFERIRDRLTT